MIVLYILTILVANIGTVVLPSLTIGALIIPPSSYFFGFTFLISNIIQDKHGAKASKMAIWYGLAVSFGLFILLKFSVTIVIASGLAFFISQYASTVLYSKVKDIWSNANIKTSLVGSVIDVAIFITLGLSPLGIGKVPWSGVFMAVIGQLLVQCSIQIIASRLINK